MPARPNLKDHSLESLRAQLAAEGLRPFRAEQIAGWLYQRGVEDPAGMTDLSSEDRARLAERWELPEIYRDVIWLHHLSPPALPSRIANPALIGLVQLADALARQG